MEFPTNVSRLLPADMEASLIRLGLLDPGEDWKATPLGGGVASEIWRIESGNRVFCAKQALPRLKVAMLWEAPVERNAYEVAWYETVRDIVPGAVPEILGHDPQSNLFAMSYFPPECFSVWKHELRDGKADRGVAGRLANILAGIHSYTAENPELSRKFPTDEMFFALRPEPYLTATGQKHPDLAGRLSELSDVTMKTKKALVHGDISPKNILRGDDRLVILDAECAWWGDPAFDLAFCLNHLLLKCLWNPAASDGFLACFLELSENYLNRVAWEDPKGLERRVAHLLPGLMLGRVDGKSPVEYLKTDPEKELVRRFARIFLKAPEDHLSTIAGAWNNHVFSRSAFDHGR